MGTYPPCLHAYSTIYGVLPPCLHAYSTIYGVLPPSLHAYSTIYGVLIIRWVHMALCFYAVLNLISDVP